MNKRRRNIVGVLTGFALVSVIGLGYFSNHVLSLERIRSKEDDRVVKNLQESVGRGVISNEKASIEFVEKGNYTELDFNTVDSFLNSLQSLVRVNNCDTLHREYMYDSNKKVLVSLYENEVLSVAVSPEDEILYCRFSGVSEDEETQIKTLSEQSNFKYKIINNGFVLEKEL